MSTQDVIDDLQRVLKTLDLPLCPESVAYIADVKDNLIAATPAFKVGCARESIRSAIEKLARVSA